MLITVSLSQTYCRCTLQTTWSYDATVYIGINALCGWGQRQFSSHKFFRAAALEPLCCLTMERANVFLQHLPRALILCSGTSYLLCMFTCTSAFDGLLGLILAMLSLSQLSSVGLGRTSGRKTAAGRKRLKKRSKYSRIRSGVCVCVCGFVCTACCIVLCATQIETG